MMQMETIVRLLKLYGNCNVSAETLKANSKTKIEQECGFEITVKSSQNDNTNYILERK